MDCEGRLEDRDRRGNKRKREDKTKDENEDEYKEASEDAHKGNEARQSSGLVGASRTMRASKSACQICRAIFTKGLIDHHWTHIYYMSSDMWEPCIYNHVGPWAPSGFGAKVSIASDLLWYLKPGEEWSRCCLRAPNGLYMKRSGERGCPFCVQAWRAFQLQQTKHKAESYAWLGSQVNYVGYGSWKVTHSMWTGVKNSEIEIVLSIYPSSVLSTQEPIAMSNKDDGFPDKLSATSINHCWLWIDQCIKSHEQCKVSNRHTGRRQTTSELYPSRIIDVSADPPRLCLTKDFAPGVRYATLSHCWGTSYSKKHLLKRGKLKMFQRSLPMSDLPKTFREAISFTQKVLTKYDVKYLWIDSLCIIQNSKRDWLEESARMASVYSNAFCNLAATASSDGSGGLFYPRHTNMAHYAVVKLDVPVLDEPNTGPRKSNAEDCIITVADQWERVIQDSPLNQRAWVVQERILSPRTIHFAEDMLYWQCTSHTASEDLHHGRLKIAELSEQDCKELVQSLPAETFSSPDDIRSTWKQIVERYMKCKITYSDDRLQAFSGIAALFQRHFKDSKYHAGLWGDQLERQLLWRTLRSEREEMQIVLSAQRTAGAPSWSWASSDCPVNIVWYDQTERLLMSILKIEISLAGTDAYGRTTSARLSLRCIPIFGKGRELARFPFEFETMFGIDFMPFWFDMDDKNYKKPDNIVCCVPVLCTVTEKRCVCSGLVLESTGATFGEYRRIGVFLWDTDEKQSFRHSLEEVKRVFLEWSDKQSLYRGGEREPNGECVISVV